MEKSKKYFITGIDTGIGKTLVSAVLVQYLNADYWKPVQSGSIEGTDSNFVKQYLKKGRKVYKESYCFKAPISPNFAAEEEHVAINSNFIDLPETENNLIVEGAGGIMVPINDNELILDLIKKLNLEVIIVSKHYLGSINHTLLTAYALAKMNIPVAGIIFNGEENERSEKIILSMTNLEKITHIPQLNNVSRKSVQSLLKKIKINHI